MLTKSSTCSTLRSNDCLFAMKRSPALPKLDRILSFDMISLKKPATPSSLIWRSRSIRLSLSPRAMTFNYIYRVAPRKPDDHSRHHSKHRVGLCPHGLSRAAREYDRDVYHYKSCADSADCDRRVAPRTLAASMDGCGTPARRMGARRGHDHSGAEAASSAAIGRSAVSAYFRCCLIHAAVGAKTWVSDLVPASPSRWPHPSSLVNDGSGASVDFDAASTWPGQFSPKLVLANAITGIFDALSDAISSGVNGFSPS